LVNSRKHRCYRCYQRSYRCQQLLTGNCAVTSTEQKKHATTKRQSQQKKELTVPTAARSMPKTGVQQHAIVVAANKTVPAVDHSYATVVNRSTVTLLPTACSTTV
jgi:UDP-glucose 6-dehydrogenase